MLPESSYLDRIDSNSLRIKNTRVGLEHLILLYREGYTAEELAVEFPTVSLEQVHGVIAYYLGNRVAVDDYIKAGEEQFEEYRRQSLQKPPSEAVQRIRAIKEAQARR
jgi:uncharacterized protein (DUF433 family)